MDEALDPFRITDKLEDVLLDVMVSRFEARGNHPFFQKVLQEYLDAMRIDAAATVLDMGCGTGVAARTIARASARHVPQASSFWGSGSMNSSPVSLARTSLAMTSTTQSRPYSSSR